MTEPQSNSVDLKALADAVERLHGAKALFVGSVPVNEEFDGATVWKGLVSEFELRGHTTATRCYAWSVPATSNTRQRFYAVLHTPAVNTAAKAVQASIVADRHRSGGTNAV